MTPGASLPLRTADNLTRDILTRAFDRSGFSERIICERLGIAALDAVDQPLFKSQCERLAGSGPLEVFGRLLLAGDLLDRRRVREQLTEDEVNALLATDLVRQYDGAGSEHDRVFSPVRVVPVSIPGQPDRNLMMAGDRSDHPDGAPFRPFADIVFPGHNPLTRQFLRVLAGHRAATVLDMCSGSGIAGLALAASSSRCTAADVAERSTHFARFNGWLNGSAEFEAVCGNLYEPVLGQYDCILAHPPYVPALSQELTYRDGGEAGEEIVRGVISGVPAHLKVGGTFHMLCLGMDTAEGAFEHRVRQWLGPSGDEFDIVFALDSATPPELIATRLIERSGGSPSDLARWRGVFERLQVKEFVYGAVVGRRFGTAGGPPQTRRVLMTNETSADGFTWLFQWFDWLREPNMAERILSATLRLAPDLRLQVEHQIEDGAFTPVSYHIENGGRPFRARLRTEPWVVALLAELDGRRSVRELFESAKVRGRVPGTVSAEDVATLATSLLERGCLKLDQQPGGEHGTHE